MPWQVFDDLELVVPRCFILATSVFDEFMDSNALLRGALNAQTDAEVEGLFDAAQLSSDVSASLRTFLEGVETPLAVRSSSLFEDAFMQPFAGIYESVMLPNNPVSASPFAPRVMYPCPLPRVVLPLSYFSLSGATRFAKQSLPLDERVEQLKWAVKRVYASTYSQQARRYAESMQNRTEEEKMAVILQPVVGSADVAGQYYYPSLGGVANSVDFYPRPNTSPLNGCASVGLGLGASVVDGMPAVHFSLGDTAALSGPSPTTLPVMALDLTANPTTRSCVITLPDAAEAALAILPKPSEIHMAPEAATTVPLTTDVHGERVVFRESYGEVKQASSKTESTELQTVALPQLLSGEVGACRFSRLHSESCCRRPDAMADCVPAGADGEGPLFPASAGVDGARLPR